MGSRDIRQYNFQEKLQGTQGVEIDKQICRIFRKLFPEINQIRLATIEEDKKGTDYFLDFEQIRSIRIDVKIREQDFGKNDLALEVWANMEHEKVGWTRDSQKETDYILWLWKDTARYHFIPFLLLRRIFEIHFKTWMSQFKTAIQDSGDWQSQCVFVPVNIIWRAIYELANSNS